MEGKSSNAEIINKLIKSYDEIAQQYAKVHNEMPPNVLSMAKEFVRISGTGILILDVGCGTGRDMAWFESAGIQVVGIDISQGMLKEAQTRVEGGLSRMDLRYLGFSAKVFQSIWCNASFLHLPKIEKSLALSELRRVLTVGGLLFVSVQEGIGEGWEVSDVGSVERWFSRYTEEELIDILKTNGFFVIQSHKATANSTKWLNLMAICR